MVRGGRVRLGSIAFCSGWWLAGAVLGLRHFIGLWRRGTHSVLELLGVPLLAGVLLPGAQPVFAAAGLRHTAGLPVGFVAILTGTVLGGTVWILLPVAVRLSTLDRSDGARPRWTTAVAALPYVGAAGGLAVLYLHYRARGHPKRRAAGTALAAAAVAYVAGALVILALALAYLAI